MLTVNNISNKLALDYSTFQRHKVAFYNFPLDRVLRICRFPQTFCSSGHLVIFFYLSHLLVRPSASLFKDILRLLNGVLNSKQKTCSFFKLVMNMQVLGGCIVLMKQKASFVSASFNESRYEIQGFLHTLFLENEAQTSEKKTKTVYIE